MSDKALSIFVCGGKPPTYPVVTVLVTHVELWTALGWEDAGPSTTSRGARDLEWRRGGEPQRPRRFSAGGGR